MLQITAHQQKYKMSDKENLSQGGNKTGNKLQIKSDSNKNVL